jgi:hypothetical protein
VPDRAVPADVCVEATLYVNSDPNDARRDKWCGKASTAGVYGSAQGARTLALDAPGEYAAHVLATYTDSKSHLWVCSMRHAGVAYPESSPIAARGKFEYFFDPKRINERTPTYDIEYRVNGRPEVGDIVHLTFLSKEKHASGQYHSFARIILRGNRVVCTR